MKHQWETDNKVQPNGKVLANCKVCKLQGEVIWMYVYPFNGPPGGGPIPDNCPGK